MISQEIVKVGLLLILLITTFVLSMIPLLLTKYTQRANASRAKRRLVKSGISLMSCFAAGVFLATCLLDLFPDASDKLSAALVRMEVYTAYPVTEFIVVVGFIVIFLIEQIILSRKESHRGGETEPLLFHESIDSLNNSYTIENGNVRRHVRNPCNSVTDSVDHSDIVSLTPDDDLDQETPQNEIYVDPNSHSIIRSLMLLLALSLHSVFEGLAVGLQPSTDSVLEIFVPVALHKSILAFALGLNLTQSKLTVKAIIRSNVIFAVTSPIGIGIGILITDFAPDSGITDMVNGIIQAIACGTFLFVVFFEILPHEFMGRRHYPCRLLKTLLLVLGYSTVACLLFLDPDVVRPSRYVPATPKP